MFWFQLPFQHLPFITFLAALPHLDTFRGSPTQKETFLAFFAQQMNFFGKWKQKLKSAFDGDGEGDSHPRHRRRSASFDVTFAEDTLVRGH